MQTRIGLSIVAVLTVAVGFCGVSDVMAAKKPSTVKDVKSLSEQEQVKLALSAAPLHITKEASVMIYGAEGKLTETKKGTNGQASDDPQSVGGSTSCLMGRLMRT